MSSTVTRVLHILGVAVAANALAFGLQWDLACRTNAQTCAAASLCP